MTMSPLPTTTPATAPPDDLPFVLPRFRWVRKHPTLIAG
ncbi:peptide ABC transporter permease, partial [Xenophilus aerolatus]|nr:peptide ABC transporter permease [Xenophilus aerolatus]